jgi:hypothetical protein
LQHIETRLNCLKNVSKKERDAPAWQIVLGLIDTAFLHFCVLTNLALWIELNLRSNPNVFKLLDNNSILSGGQKSKKEIAQQLMCGKIFKMEAFTGPTHANNDGAVDHLGSHSIRKFAPKHSHCCRFTNDNKQGYPWFLMEV